MMSDFRARPGTPPNRRIALTNKLFTYLLAGIPVVMSEIPAHRDIAPAMGDAARLYPVDDPAGLAAALDTLLGDPASLASARNAAWRLGQERFNWDVEQVNAIETDCSSSCSWRCMRRIASERASD